ncbi:hypothetical protein F4813DRAFT_386858 [Daldinia decipiens]|uniref:uncharacterized protein n=1 Tax=Daldinia decipiens TaxID=326647 RepID=UPI0020C38926|nr:uncharacterized protein F4813DRAFT_386858 [Daldinia decipiens]KAI1659989.1 hypothetical protein F4813DRAFT_386858 [Daldinia decipiens]
MSQDNNSNWQGEGNPDFNPLAPPLGASDIYAAHGGIPDNSSTGQANSMAFNNANATSSTMTTQSGMASGMSSASSMSPMPLMHHHLPPTPQPSMSPISPITPTVFGAMAAASMGQGYQGWAGNMNMALAYGSRQTNQNAPGMPMGLQSQGMLHQYQIGQSSMPSPASIPGPAMTRPLSSRPPMPQRRLGMVGSSSGSGADSSTSGPERDPAHRVTKKQGKQRRTNDKDGDLSMSDSSTLKWKPGMRLTKILDSWPEERKEATRIRNEMISKCKAAHTRDQNRVSARKSRQKKEDALQDARSNVQRLQEQNAALSQQVHELNARINIYQLDIQNRGQSIAMLASDNASLQSRINQLEMQILQGGQGVQELPAGQMPAQQLTPVLPPYSSQVQSQIQGSMFMQNSDPTMAQVQGQAAPGVAQGQAPSSYDAQEGLGNQEPPRGGDLPQGQEAEGTYTHALTSGSSPTSTSQDPAKPGDQVDGKVDNGGDIPFFDYQGFFNDGNQA